MACCGAQGMVPARAEGPPLIIAAPVMGIMLGLLRGCDEADERMATLQALQRLTGWCGGLDHTVVACGFASSTTNVLLALILASRHTWRQPACQAHVKQWDS